MASASDNGPMGRKPTTIDEYLAGVPADRRAALEKLRTLIRSLAPDVEECISYSIPAFRRDGRVIAGFQSTSKGCSYFPFSGSTLATLEDELVGYDKTKSALHFDAKNPLRAPLVRALLRARMAEPRKKKAAPTRARAAKKKKGKGNAPQRRRAVRT